MKTNEDFVLGKEIVCSKSTRLSKFVKSNFYRSFVFALNKAKLEALSRLFWGRGLLYKQLLHIFLVFLTSGFALTGIIYRISSASASEQSFSDKNTGDSDIISQGGSIESVLLTDPEVGGLKTIKHTVSQNETLDQISKKYNVTKDTIRWANIKVGSLAFTDKLQEGWELTIPEINGVIYEVKGNESLDEIVTSASLLNDEANKFNIAEFNGLVPPYDLSKGQKLFIPDGNLTDPVSTDLIDIPTGVFIDPLEDESCEGYVFTRGFLSYHNGVDLAKGTGCIISAAANGVVTYAGWGSAGQGYWVEIDHGSGIKTQYFHGDGTFYIQKGAWVLQGDPIMYMGTTGNSTGTHLHFSLWKNGSSVNPRPYVPYIGSY